MARHAARGNTPWNTEVKALAESKGPWDVYNVLSTVKPKDAYPALADSECPLAKATASR